MRHFLTLAVLSAACAPTVVTDAPYPAGAHPIDPNEIQTYDINQGSYGDCWLLSAVYAAVGRDPNFATERLAVDGNTIWVRLYSNRGAEWVPVDADTNDPSGNMVLSGLNWPGAIEQAFLDLHGRTAFDSVGGVSAVAWQALYGRPGVTAAMAPGAMLALAAQGATHPVTACTGAPTALAIPLHCYAVESADGDAIVLANPWGLFSSPLPALTRSQFLADFVAVSRAD